MIPFKNIPSNLRVPLFYAEVDNSRANTAVAVQRTLILGQYTSLSGAVANVPVLSQGAADAAARFGPASNLALMVAMYRENDPFGELWCLPVADDPAAVAATGTLQFTAAASVNGAFYLYVAGRRYALPVLSTQTAAQLAVALAALVNANPASPVAASTSGSTVTFTAVNKGLTGNDIDLRVNYGGAAAGEAAPAGLAWTIVPMANGLTSPSLTLGLANLASTTFDFIVSPYTDSISLDALKALLNDSTGRWSFSQQMYGHVFAARSGTAGALMTFGATRNHQHESVAGIYDSPTPAWLIASALGGAAAASLRSDPGLPLQTLALRGVLPPPVQNRFTLAVRNSMLYTGVSTLTETNDGTVVINNLITTYQTNAFNGADDSYLQVETMFLLAFVLRDLHGTVTSKFSRVKLASNGTRTSSPNVVTPNIIRGEIIARYRVLEEAGYVQDGDVFKKGLIVEKSATNPNRVDVLWPGILVNQLRVFALLAQFRLTA